MGGGTLHTSLYALTCYDVFRSLVPRVPRNRFPETSRTKTSRKCLTHIGPVTLGAQIDFQPVAYQGSFRVHGTYRQQNLAQHELVRRLAACWISRTTVLGTDQRLRNQPRYFCIFPIIYSRLIAAPVLCVGTSLCCAVKYNSGWIDIVLLSTG